MYLGKRNREVGRANYYWSYDRCLTPIKDRDVTDTHVCTDTSPDLRHCTPDGLKTVTMH